MKPKHKRLVLIIVALTFIGVGFTLITTQMKEHMVFFYSPTDLHKIKPSANTTIRIGGLVKTQSIIQKDTHTIVFIITDLEHEIYVQYTGILPNLFREGQGVIAKGTLNNASTLFIATEILAKHDENYMPPEIAESLKKSGHWQHNTTTPDKNDGQNKQ